MNGESLKYKLGEVLRESANSSFWDSRSSYDYLYEAAKKFASRTKTLSATWSANTVANQTNYDLPWDFGNLFFRNSQNQFVLKHTDSSNNVSWLPFRNYENIRQANNVDSVTNPSCFSIVDNANVSSMITGTASANGANSLGECTLTDSSNASQFANANVGDDVHNTTDGSNGVVIVKTSNTALVTALFGGTNNAWAANDVYVVVPQGLKQVIIDPPSSVSNSVLSMEYIQIPTPVYSPYRTYRFDSQYEMAIVFYAAWLYKYKDDNPDAGNAWFKAWDEACRRAVKESNKQLGRVDFRVNLIRRSTGARSYR